MLVNVVVFFDVAEWVLVDIDNAVVAWAADVQRCGVVPQRPDEEQHSLAAHGFKDPRSDQLLGRAVPGTWGPQTAFGSATGIGGSPELRQMKEPCDICPHPGHAQLRAL